MAVVSSKIYSIHVLVSIKDIFFQFHDVSHIYNVDKLREPSVKIKILRSLFPPNFLDITYWVTELKETYLSCHQNEEMKIIQSQEWKSNLQPSRLQSHAVPPRHDGLKTKLQIKNCWIFIVILESLIPYFIIQHEVRGLPFMEVRYFLFF